MKSPSGAYERGLVDGVHKAQGFLRLVLPQFLREVRTPPEGVDGPMTDWELIDMLVTDLDLVIHEVVRKHNEGKIG